MSLLNTGKFWNLEKDFFSESTNSGPLYYNTYEEFVTGSKNNSNIKKFEYEDPFKFIPSYGSRVSIIFYKNIQEFGDNYLSVNQGLINRILIEFDLKFNERGNEETELINNYINEREGFNEFVYQPTDQSKLNQPDYYKSLYSLPPYFVQNFKCKDKTVENIYTDHNSIKLSFINQDFSQFDMKNLLMIESMPQEKKDIIEEYSEKYHLDIEPSYSITRGELFNSKTFDGGEKTRLLEESSGINKSNTSLELSFDAINDDILLKLLSFFISKQGFETFTFELKDPDQKILNFYCLSIEHTFLFKNSHNLKVGLEESYIRRRFNWGY